MAELRAPKGATKSKKIRGRGQATGVGGTAGRGHKGQKARSGGGVRLGFEGGQMPLFRRIARRGFSNARFKKVFIPINLTEIEKKFSDGETVNLETLKSKGIISAKQKDIKILGTGTLTKKLNLDMKQISSSAKEKVEKAGGTVKDYPKIIKKSKKHHKKHVKVKVAENDGNNKEE